MGQRFLWVFAGLLAGCGGGGGERIDDPPAPDTGDSAGLGRYSLSEPLVDNAGAGSYKVLLMGNSHAAGLLPVLDQVLTIGQPDKTIDVQITPGSGFLADKVNDGFSEQKLESETWTHVILQGQKYSTTGVFTYPTDAAEYWVRGSKLQGATPIMFPEHPRQNNTWESQALWDIHTGIASRENTCVAPVGFSWDEVLARDSLMPLHSPDGNHATDIGHLLTALVFYPIITGEPVDSLPTLSAFGVDGDDEQVMKEVVAIVLASYATCRFEG